MERQITNQTQKIIAAIQLIVTDQGLSQTQVAEKSKLSQSNICRILSGETVSPKLSNLRQIAKALAGGIEPLLHLAQKIGDRQMQQRKLPAFSISDIGSVTQGNGSLSAIHSHSGKVIDASEPLDAIIPGESLLHLLGIRDELLGGLVDTPTAGRFYMITEKIRQFFNAEACALFLITNDSRDELVLKASSSERCPPDFNIGMKLKIQTREGGGLTGHIAKHWQSNKATVMTFNAQELNTSQFVAGKYHEHLSAGKGFSTMFIPLTRHNGQLLGLISVANRKDTNGEATESAFFDQTGKLMAAHLAKTVTLLIETQERFEVFHSIMNDMQVGGDLEAILKLILKRCVDLLRADRGDFALWDPNLRDIALRAVEGDTMSRDVKRGMPAPERGFIRAVWSSQAGFRISNNVAREPYYHPCDPRVKSELAIRFDLNGRPLGVLNLESFRENAFNEQDLQVLGPLAKYAAMAAQVAGEEAHLASAVEQLLTNSVNLKSNLQSILATLRGMFNFDGGLIFSANHDQKELRCEAGIGCDHLDRAEVEAFKFHYSQNSAAVNVFKNGDFFSSIPQDDKKVDKAGLALFRIRGPLIGVRLEFAERLVGVLMAWSTRGNPPTEAHRKRLRPLAKLAAWTIATFQSKQTLQAELDIVQALPQRIFRKDLNGCFTFVNRAFCDSVGLTYDKILGKQDNDIFIQELANKYRADDVKVINSGEILSNQIEVNKLLSGRGESLVMVTKIPIKNSSGKTIGIQGIYSEMSDKAVAQLNRYRNLSS